MSIFNLTCVVNSVPQFLKVTPPGDYIIPVRIKFARLTCGELDGKEDEKRGLEEILRKTVLELRYSGSPLPIFLDNQIYVTHNYHNLNYLKSNLNTLTSLRPDLISLLDERERVLAMFYSDRQGS